MKIRITKSGELKIDGRMKLCPFDQPMAHMPKIPCGDWCAHFNSEEYFLSDVHSVIKIEICHKKYLSTDKKNFTDERPNP